MKEKEFDKMFNNVEIKDKLSKIFKKLEEINF